MRFPHRFDWDDEGRSEQDEAAYQAQLAQWWQEMPYSIAMLARGISVHDGKIRRFGIDRARRTAHLRIRCGWIQVGYYDLDLRFRGVWFPGTTVAKLERLAARGPTTPDALHEEIDRDDAGRWIYRIKLWRDREVQITFTDLALEMTPRLDRYSRR